MNNKIITLIKKTFVQYEWVDIIRGELSTYSMHYINGFERNTRKIVWCYWTINKDNILIALSDEDSNLLDSKMVHVIDLDK